MRWLSHNANNAKVPRHALRAHARKAKASMQTSSGTSSRFWLDVRMHGTMPHMPTLFLCVAQLGNRCCFCVAFPIAITRSSCFRTVEHNQLDLKTYHGFCLHRRVSPVLSETPHAVDLSRAEGVVQVYGFCCAAYGLVGGHRSGGGTLTSCCSARGTAAGSSRIQRASGKGQPASHYSNICPLFFRFRLR